MPVAGYDADAEWYDRQVGGDDHPSDCWVCESVRTLDDGRSGLVLDIGCGTAAHRSSYVRDGREVVGLDVSLAQLSLARGRLRRVVAGDVVHAPLRRACADVVVSTFVHTDVASAEALFKEIEALMAPGATAVVVGAHPCFNNPFFGRDADGRFVVHEGYLTGGFYRDGPGLGDGVRRRVGVHHLPLAEFLNAVGRSGLRVEHWAEGGADPPGLLAFRARRQS